ncbi:hypothetical protein E2I00_008659, partial [Balaenoptera physalus]
APNCTWKSTQSDPAFFTFRRDPARCQKWVENCKRADLEDKTSDQLNIIDYNAMPTTFDLTSHLNNPHSRHRKRIKELSEDEIRILKQKKIEGKQYLKSLFEILILMEKQNIPLDGHEADEIPEGLFTPDNFQALPECRINSGEEVLRKRFETTA